jgi:DNA-binding IclR family transcriptional regulator
MERVATEIGTECVAIAPVDDQLVVLASAGSPSGGAEFTRVGQRMPFVPPIGTPFLAWAPESDVAAWLARAGQPLTDEVRAQHLELLARVRDRGWSLSLGDDRHNELLDAIERYSEGDPEGRAHVQRLGTELAYRFEPAHELDEAGEYDVRLLSVPVFGPDGSVVLSLTLWGLPYPSTGADVHRYLEIVRTAAQAIGKSIGERAGQPPA